MRLLITEKYTKKPYYLIHIWEQKKKEHSTSRAELFFSYIEMSCIFLSFFEEKKPSQPTTSYLSEEKKIIINIFQFNRIAHFGRTVLFIKLHMLAFIFSSLFYHVRRASSSTLTLSSTWTSSSMTIAITISQ